MRVHVVMGDADLVGTPGASVRPRVVSVHVLIDFQFIGVSVYDTQNVWCMRCCYFCGIFVLHELCGENSCNTLINTNIVICSNYSEIKDLLKFTVYQTYCLIENE